MPNSNNFIQFPPPLSPLTEHEVAQQATEQILGETLRATNVLMAFTERRERRSTVDTEEPHRARDKTSYSDTQQPPSSKKILAPTITDDINGATLDNPPPVSDEAVVKTSFVADPVTAADDDSGDDAPEEGKVGASEDYIGHASTKVAEMAAEQAELRRARRQQHNERMKKQARTSKQRAKARVDPSLQADSPQDLSEMPKPRQQTNGRHSPSLALLPEELLNTEPFVAQEPSPISTQEKRASLKRKVLLDHRDKPPSDIVRGSTRIRVLSSTPSTLPPKGNFVGKELRERWLLGRRGHDPATWKRRKEPSTAFSRRKR